MVALSRELKELIKRKINKRNSDLKAEDSKKILDNNKELIKKFYADSKALDKLKKKLTEKNVYCGYKTPSVNCLENKIDVTEEYFKIIEEIEVGDDSSLKEIFERISKLK